MRCGARCSKSQITIDPEVDWIDAWKTSSMEPEEGLQNLTGVVEARLAGNGWMHFLAGNQQQNPQNDWTDHAHRPFVKAAAELPGYV